MAATKVTHPFFASKEDRLRLQAEAEEREKTKKQLNPIKQDSDPLEQSEDPPSSAPKPKKPRKSRQSLETTDKDIKPSRKKKKNVGEIEEWEYKPLKTRRSLGITGTDQLPVDAVSTEPVSDPNEARRKRRRKSPPEAKDNGASEDVVMSDAPTSPVRLPLERVIVISPEKPKPAPPPLSLSTKKKEENRSKKVHPFFTGGVKPVKDPSDNPPSHSSPPPPNRPSPRPAWTGFQREEKSGSSSFGGSLSPRSTKVLKIPGLLDAPWPTKEQQHVRGYNESHHTDFKRNPTSSRASKQKSRRVEVTGGDDILAGLSRKLRVNELKEYISRPEYAQEEYFRVCDNIHVPERLLLTGKELQAQVRKKIRSPLPEPGDICRRPRIERTASASSMDSASSDSLVLVIPNRKPHPAILQLYLDLRNSVCAFESGTCETQAWNNKYAPKTSREVLQNEKNMNLLRGWLEQLRVESVETAESAIARAEKKKKEKAKAKLEAARKKKKRNRDDLDGFLADSDDAKTLDELTDPEDDGSVVSLGFAPPPSNHRLQFGQKSIKVPKGNNAISNVILISGPSGCGKTAAIYAVAKELGYTVFEVNAGNRRSGKDILDQVGQMSKNHLVHQTKELVKEKNPFAISKQSKAQGDKETKPCAQQQQSLILFEEVDLLFEEDKQFWSTVQQLAMDSKRPVILTCNDESLVPVDTLPLQALLRFEAPALELAADYLLLIAANEGHILERSSTEVLYQSSHFDLRHSIAQLQFWCQMSVGDRRSGIDWVNVERLSISPTREVKRVISKGAFRKGLNLLDCLNKPDTLPEDELWADIWNQFEFDAGGEDIGMSREMQEWSSNLNVAAKLPSLDAYCAYTDALSAADVFTLDGMRCIEDAVLEVSNPKVTESVVADEIQGFVHLHDVLRRRPTTAFNTRLGTSVRSLARKALQVNTNDLITNPKACLPDISHNLLISTIANADFVRWPMIELDSRVVRDAIEPICPVLSDTVPQRVIGAEIAPYIRCIVRHDQKLVQERNSLLSQGGRTTRAARTALTGGVRRGRGDRWWKGVMCNWEGVLETGNPEWKFDAPANPAEDVPNSIQVQMDED